MIQTKEDQSAIAKRWMQIVERRFADEIKKAIKEKANTDKADT